MDVLLVVMLYADSGAVPGNSYELEVTISGSAAPALFIDGEPNDSQATAYDLGSVATSVDLSFESNLGHFSNLDLSDWWEFTLTGRVGTCFDLEVGFLGSPTLNADVDIYRPNGSLITGDSFSSGNDALLENVSGSPIGTYFVRILPSTVPIGGYPYSIDIDAKPTFSCP